VSIADLPIEERPRERLARGGAIALSDAELLALLIEPGHHGKSSLDIARELVSDGLRSLARREWIPGRPVGSLGPARVARIAAALELGRRIAALSATSSEPLRDPEMLAQRLIARYAHAVQETLGAIYLDTRDRIIREREIFVGSLNTAAVSSRDVVRFALEDHAASVIVFHNHPSGDPSPSGEDVLFTRKLIEAGKVMDVNISDHIVVAASGYVSMKQRNLM
jgi:DNA repair protein RadC